MFSLKKYFLSIMMVFLVLSLVVLIFVLVNIFSSWNYIDNTFSDNNSNSVINSSINNSSSILSSQQNVILNDSVNIPENNSRYFISDDELLPDVIIGDVIPSSRNSNNDDSDDSETFDDQDYSQYEDDLNNVIINSDDYSFSVYVYTDTVLSWDSEDLSNVIQNLGFDRVFLSTKYALLNDDLIYTKKISDLIYSLHQKNIIVSGLFMTDPGVFFDRDMISRFLLSFLFYQSNQNSGRSFDELTFDIEPQLLTPENNYDSFQGYYWQGSDGYGIGSSNDILLGETQNILSSIDSEYNGKISQTTTYFFHDKNLEGLTDYGSVNIFLDSVDEVIIMDYDNRLETIISRAESELKDSNDEKSITIALKSKSSSLSTDSIYGFTYSEFLSLKDDLIDEFEEYDSFSGLAIFEFDSFYNLYIS